MDNDMANLIDKINNMIKNNQIPEEIKNMANNLNTNSTNTEDLKNITPPPNTSSSENTSNPEFDIETIMKMKSIIDSMKSNANDPRANLLRSLKPYLKESRKSKVDQYVQLFNIGKVFENFNTLGGDSKK